jgi:hypothetical protein
MEENDINTTAWPAQSLDISFMEILWLKLERHFLSTRNLIDSRNRLISKIARVTKNLPVNFICQLNSTIPTRIQKVIKMKDNLTKYQGKTTIIDICRTVFIALLM